jgi:hypothetical protein
LRPIEGFEKIAIDVAAGGTTWGKVKGKVVPPVLNLIKHYAMKAYEGVDV